MGVSLNLKVVGGLAFLVVVGVGSEGMVEGDIEGEGVCWQMDKQGQAVRQSHLQVVELFLQGIQ